MAHPIGAKFGAGPDIKFITAATTLTADDSHKTIFLNTATGVTVTLPAVAVSAGVKYDFIIKTANTATNYVITEVTASDTDVIIATVNELETDTNDDGPSSTGCTQVNFIAGTCVVGDAITFVSDGVKWFARGQVVADGAVTLS